MKNFFLVAFCLLCITFKANASEDSCLPKYRFNGKRLILTEQEWKERLTPEQFYVLREGGTESPYDNAYNETKEAGIYSCAGCGLALFSSEAKFDSKTGWPSFLEPICSQNVTYKDDYLLFWKRIEVLCSRCEGHLGHVFNDGPPPTHKRYCMNSAALKFIPN